MKINTGGGEPALEKPKKQPNPTVHMRAGIMLYKEILGSMGRHGSRETLDWGRRRTNGYYQYVLLAPTNWST
jgi:hypothetical protein